MFKVVWMYNGIPGEDASILFASMPEVQEFVVSMKRKYLTRFTDPKLDLGICDCSTGRITSHRRLMHRQVHHAIAHLGAVSD